MCPFSGYFLVGRMLPVVVADRVAIEVEVRDVVEPSRAGHALIEGGRESRGDVLVDLLPRLDLDRRGRGRRRQRLTLGLAGLRRRGWRLGARRCLRGNRRSKREHGRHQSSSEPGDAATTECMSAGHARVVRDSR